MFIFSLEWDLIHFNPQPKVLAWKQLNSRNVGVTHVIIEN